MNTATQQPPVPRRAPVPEPPAGPGLASQARLFDDLQRSDPRAADRLARGLEEMPEVGTTLLGFHLVGELGRGAFSRVFLAQQTELAGRQVALKVAIDLRGESQTLAQLQHTNIVPIYSVHAAEPFQAACMPFFGARTLSDVLAGLRGRERLPESGRELLDTLVEKQSTGPSQQEAESVAPATLDLHGHGSATRAARPTTVTQPARAKEVNGLQRAFAGLSYVEAVLWIAERLADGLAYAHQRGIVHRDLKPANVLLGDDGQPMLLDFNVAEDVKLRGNPTAASVGGTLPYMAPEHLAAMQGDPVKVDERCDIYSFGIILFELLTGQYPFASRYGAMDGGLCNMIRERSEPPPRLRCWNRAVSPAVESIVRHCLEPDLGRRYFSAKELHEDLQRHRNHLPLKHAPEPSWRERSRKWAWRHPRLTSTTTVVLLAAGLVLGLAALAVVRGQRLARWEARQAAVETWDGFHDDLKTARFLLSARHTEPDQRRAGAAAARKALGRYQVEDGAAWDARPDFESLSPAERQQLTSEVGELLLLLAGATVLDAENHTGADVAEDPLRSALQLNQLAEACCPELKTSPALWRQRADIAHRLGDAAETARWETIAGQLPLRSVRDYYWAASEQVLRGQHRDAVPLLRKATVLEPQHFWAWFVLGTCHDRLGEDARAETCYSVCTTLEPPFPWSYFNRALTHLRRQDFASASADFDEVLRLQPDLTDALINRALARQGLGQLAEAANDLTAALEAGAADTRIYFLRSRLREKLHDGEGARHDLEEGLRRRPADEKSWIARGLARLERDPHAALADFEEALKLNPHSASALQNKAHVLAERLGRTEEAVQALDEAVARYPEAAPSRAGRGVLLARLGKREAALKDAEAALARDAGPARLYQVACIYALTSKQQPDDRFQAFRLLSTALRKGYGHDLLEKDADLDPVRDQPEFRRLTEAAQTFRPANAAAPKPMSPSPR